jgi:hypothetical protein
LSAIEVVVGDACPTTAVEGKAGIGNEAEEVQMREHLRRRDGARPAAAAGRSREVKEVAAGN